MRIQNVCSLNTGITWTNSVAADVTIVDAKFTREHLYIGKSTNDSVAHLYIQGTVNACGVIANIANTAYRPKRGTNLAVYIKSKLYEVEIATNGNIGIYDTAGHGGVPGWISVAYTYLLV